MPGTVLGTENMDKFKHIDKYLCLTHFRDIHRITAATQTYAIVHRWVTEAQGHRVVCSWSLRKSKGRTSVLTLGISLLFLSISLLFHLWK